MQQRKDIFDSILKSENLSLWFTGVIIGVSGFLFILILPYFLIETDNGWKIFGIMASYAYTVIAFFILIAIAVTASFYLYHLNQNASTVTNILRGEIVVEDQSARTPRMSINAQSDSTANT